MNTVCNEDCLHCPYEDCILSEVTHAAFQNLRNTNKLLAPPSQTQAYSQLYHFAHRDELNAKARERWAKNKDKYNASKKSVVHWRKKR